MRYSKKAALRVSGGLAWASSGSSRRALVLVLELSQQLITQQTVNNILHVQGFTRRWGAQVCTFDPVQALWTDFLGYEILGSSFQIQDCERRFDNSST